MIDIFSRLFNWLILTPGYYFSFEFGMGTSPAKAIMGRIVVDEYGNKPAAAKVAGPFLCPVGALWSFFHVWVQQAGTTAVIPGL